MQNSNQEIGIIALDSHFEIVCNILDILSSSQLTIHVLVSDPPNELLSPGDQIKIVKSSHHRHQSILRFLGTLKKSTNILVVTIYKDYRFFYNISRSYSLSFIIHNIHNTFADNRYKKRQSIIHLNYLKLFIRDMMFKESLYKKKLLDSSSNLYFLSLSTLNYAKANYANWKSKFKFLPYIFTSAKIAEKSSYFTIVIPGGVNAANRQYDYLNKWFSQVSITTPIRIVFLGKSSSRQCQNLISDLTDRYQNQVEITSFKEYVDQPIYDHWIAQADLLLSPLKRETTFRGYFEYYGSTKISGSINDAVKNKVPLVIPDFYPIEPNYQSLVYQYKDLHSFLEIMNSFYINPDFKKEVVVHHDISLIRKKLYETLNLEKS